jgi:hypothetical protein
MELYGISTDSKALKESALSEEMVWVGVLWED